jgi:hypothetical protein
MYQFLIDYSTETNLPLQAKNHYLQDYQLIAIVNPKVTTKFISRLIKRCSVLSISDDEGILLWADDFHLDCLNCSEKFYKTYYTTLKQLNLID